MTFASLRSDDLARESERPRTTSRLIVTHGVLTLVAAPDVIGLVGAMYRAAGLLEPTP